MKSQLSPGVIIGAIVAALAIAGGIYFFATRETAPEKAATATDPAKGPPMPSDVQAEFAKRMGGGAPTGPGAKPGVGAPTGPGGAPMMTGPGSAGAGR